MAYSFDPIFAADPNNPQVVAANASILLYDPNDVTKAPVTLTDITGAPVSNPVTVNKNGFGPAIKHSTLDRLAWDGGGFSGVFTSYEGMKAEAVAARTAAEAAQSAAETAGADAASEASAALAGAVADAEAAQAAAAASAALVGAPADTVMATVLNDTGSAARGALNATYVTYVDSVTGLPLVGKHVIIKVDQTTDDIADIIVEDI